MTKARKVSTARTPTRKAPRHRQLERRKQTKTLTNSIPPTKANLHMTTVWMRRQAKTHQQVGSLSKAKQLTKSTHRHQAANRRGNSQKKGMSHHMTIGFQTTTKKFICWEEPWLHIHTVASLLQANFQGRTSAGVICKTATTATRSYNTPTS